MSVMLSTSSLKLAFHLTTVPFLSRRDEKHVKYEKRDCSCGLLSEEACEKGGEAGSGEG